MQIKKAQKNLNGLSEEILQKTVFQEQAIILWILYEDQLNAWLDDYIGFMSEKDGRVSFA